MPEILSDVFVNDFSENIPRANAFTVNNLQCTIKELDPLYFERNFWYPQLGLFRRKSINTARQNPLLLLKKQAYYKFLLRKKFKEPSRRFLTRSN